MINYDQALSIIKKAARKKTMTLLPIEHAVGRTVAEKYVSHQLIPAFPNSSMDGFAVKSEETQTASYQKPIRFPVIGSVVAGDPIPKGENNSGVWEIMTGAPFPPGMDAAVKIEDVQVFWDKTGRTPLEIEITQPASKGQNYRNAGEDFQVGTLILESGTILMPEHILALATLGISEISVFEKPTIVIISTGKELAHDAASLCPGQIPNSTAPFLMAALSQQGVQASHYGSVGDDPADFMRLMSRAVEDNPDIIITTGGISMGKEDFVASALSNLGAEICFHHLAIRPGKPNIFAKFKNGTVVFGLPGNPVSTVVGLRFLIEPFLRELTGRSAEIPLRARLKNDVIKPRNLRCFFKARFEIVAPEIAEKNDFLQIEVQGGQASFMVQPLLTANSWAVLPEEIEKLETGTWIDVYPLRSFSDNWPGIWNNDLRNSGDFLMPIKSHSSHKISHGESISHKGCC
ncbi:MAG: gephyrin-like molybdotransferase Glp [Bdellovibrionia bacterium]